MGSHSKLKVGGDGEDKISQLPDGVLSHVLSFLPTKHAVRTSILSTRWKNIWASVHCLDLEHYYCDERRLQGDNVEKIELPKTIFLCKTLVVLKLNLKSNCFIYAPPESGCFPNLKVLHIGVDCPDKDFMEKLFTFFPLLEDLTIDGYLSSAISGTFKLFVPELKRLSIEVDSNMSYEDPYEYYFSINAPKLEFLNLKVYLLPSIIFDNAMSPVKAVASCIPDFDNLIHLKLVLHDCHHWEVLAELLHRTPNLERLVLEHNEDVYCDSEREGNSDDERYLANNANSENEETSDDEDYSEITPSLNDYQNMYCKPNREDVCCNSDCEVSDEERYLADKADLEDTENSESEETSEDEEYSDHPYSEDEEYSEEYWEHPWWQREKSAPVCLLSHLKTIVLKGFRGRRGEGSGKVFIEEW
ncbi:hypothetical protein ACLB2K_000086 [Fragaria x ananassa]